MINLNKKILLALLTLSIFGSNAFSGLPEGTKVFLGDGKYEKVENLKKGDSVVVYNIPEQAIEENLYKIQKIKKRKSKEVLFIKAGRERVLFGPKQKVYNRSICKFIPAKELKVGDSLFSPELGNLKIKKITKENLKRKIELYDISIEDGNLFLILTAKGNHILAHNFAITIPILTWTFGGELAFIGLGTLASYIGWQAAEEFFKHKARKKGWDVSGYQTRGERFDGVFLNESVPTIGDSCPIDGSVEEVLIKGSKDGGKSKGRTKEKIKTGGSDKRKSEFDRLPVRDVLIKNTPRGEVKIGYLPDGRKVVSRGFSKTAGDTNEVQDGNRRLKVRY